MARALQKTSQDILDALQGLNLIGGVWDALDVQQTSATIETYLFYSGGLSGTLVRTIVVTYTDATKDNIDTVVAT